MTTSENNEGSPGPIDASGSKHRTILDHRRYSRYLFVLVAAAVLIVLTGARLPAIGPWAEANPVALLIVVVSVVVAFALLPILCIVVVLAILVRTARRASARLGAGDVAGAQVLFQQLARWTPLLRWVLLDPTHVESMRDMVSGFAPAAQLALSAGRVPADGAAGAATPPNETHPSPADSVLAYAVIRQDDSGHRAEVARYASREEAERQRDELERLAEGYRVFYCVEGPEREQPGGLSTP
jgi:hypothetical protein